MAAIPNGSHKYRTDRTSKGWQLRQPHPGTRIIHYRCFLPDLAGFANYRRGRTDGAAVKRRCALRALDTRNWRRGRDSNPRNGLTRLHTFQACSFNHSDTSPDLPPRRRPARLVPSLASREPDDSSVCSLFRGPRRILAGPVAYKPSCASEREHPARPRRPPAGDMGAQRGIRGKADAAGSGYCQAADTSTSSNDADFGFSIR